MTKLSEGFYCLERPLMTFMSDTKSQLKVDANLPVCTSSHTNPKKPSEILRTLLWSCSLQKQFKIPLDGD